jgi:predicted O-methyltransferase YrrM
MRKILNALLKPVGLELVKHVDVRLHGLHKIDTYAYALLPDTASDYLIDIALRSVKEAWDNSLSVSDSNLPDAKYFNIFPGEHYRLLGGVARVIRPKLVVEIGTYTGMGSLALLQTVPADSFVRTFDILPWDSFQTHLNQDVFKSGRIVQHLADLSDQKSYLDHAELLNAADFIFCDGPKDGKFEYQFMRNLTQLDPKPGRILMLDDIRFKNMINLWTAIKSPKLDLSSFGHWSGSGLVDLSLGLKLEI